LAGQNRHNPDIFPIAPTRAFGQWAIPGTPIAIVAIVLTRLLGALTLPGVTDWLMAAAALLIYRAMALTWGQGFLRRQVWKAPRSAQVKLALKLFFMPALGEELLFRVLLLPAPWTATWLIWTAWALGSLLLFVLYHPLQALTFHPAGHPTFCDRRFLTLAALLGATCTVTYALTSSLLLITLIHWIVVWVWLSQLGGMARLTKEGGHEAP
jgi:predicted Abi (CAAX) family protease